MSCNYADGLSEYEDKGVLGLPEVFDTEDEVKEKCLTLTKLIENAKHVVVHTGAGISTAAGIPDFRGPKGVWTLEKNGQKPEINLSFDEAIPTTTHMALKYLIEKQYIHYIISQNIDGLHLRTGLSRTHLAELHGNMFIGQCDTCDSQYVLPTATCTVGQKYIGEPCKREVRGRSCKGRLKDTILDWEADLPEKDLEMSDYHSSLADVNICLGTTLQIVPSGNLPLKCKKFGGKLVIVNLQATKHDKKADLIINTYVDNVLEKLMKNLSLEIPGYSKILDPTKHQTVLSAIEWNISRSDIKIIKKLYEYKLRDFKSQKNSPKKVGQLKKQIKKNKDIKDDLEDELDCVDVTLETKPKLERNNKRPRLERVQPNNKKGREVLNEKIKIGRVDDDGVRIVGSTVIKKVKKSSSNKCVDLTLDSDDGDDIFVE